MQNPRNLALIGSLLLTLSPGCRALERSPSDEEVVATVTQAPPAPPTLGPTYLAKVERVEIEARGDFDASDRSWPVRVRVAGGARIKVTNAFQMGLLDDRLRAETQPVEFVQEARIRRNGFDEWAVEYDYASGPEWRRDAVSAPEVK